jgi:aspartate aminotransferase-like enzyme
MSMMFKVQISGSFGLSIFRIGQMGEQCRAPNLFRVLHALGVALARQGIDLDQSAGMAALEGHLAEHAEDIL